MNIKEVYEYSFLQFGGFLHATLVLERHVQGLWLELLLMHGWHNWQSFLLRFAEVIIIAAEITFVRYWTDYGNPFVKRCVMKSDMLLIVFGVNWIIKIIEYQNNTYNVIVSIIIIFNVTYLFSWGVKFEGSLLNRPLLKKVLLPHKSINYMTSYGQRTQI